MNNSREQFNILIQVNEGLFVSLNVNQSFRKCMNHFIMIVNLIF
jgi:hypothetical protein